MAKAAKVVSDILSLKEKIKAKSTIKETAIITESKIFLEHDVIPTNVPILNVALSGNLDGGLVPGVTMLAGPSKMFKTNLALMLAKSYLEKYPLGILLFYVSEFGSPISYFDQFEFDKERVMVTPVTDIEELKVDITNQLHNFDRDDRVIIVIDSIGSLASRKEIQDALDDKSVADMTRAKQMKSLFRIMTPHLMLKNIPLIAINHTYKTLELYSKDVVSGGVGSYYSSDNIFIIGRQQDKEESVINGYNFTIKIEKSRYVKEGSKFNLYVSFEYGVNRWSDLLDLALEAHFVVKNDSRPITFQKVDSETGEIVEPRYKRSEVDNEIFWCDILQNSKFKAFVINKYRLI